MRGGIGRVRERLYKVVTETAAAPDVNGHGNGHGAPHAVEANGRDHTAISAGAGSTQAESGEGDEH